MLLHPVPLEVDAAGGALAGLVGAAQEVWGEVATLAGVAAGVGTLDVYQIAVSRVDLCVYVWVCEGVYVCVHVRVHVYVHVHMCVCVCVFVHVCVWQVSACVCMHVCVCARVCTCACVCAYV